MQTPRDWKRLREIIVAEPLENNRSPFEFAFSRSNFPNVYDRSVYQAYRFQRREGRQIFDEFRDFLARGIGFVIGFRANSLVISRSTNLSAVKLELV